MNEIKQQVCEIFNNSQEITFNSNEGIESLRKIIKENTEDSMRTEFIAVIQNCIDILLTSTNFHKVHYTKEFLVEFIANLNKSDLEQLIQNELLSYLAQNLRANSDLVRQRICEFISMTLKSINKQDPDTPAELDTKIFNLIQSNLIERFRDSNQLVQREAIKATISLQEPKSKTCPVISELVYLLRNDPNSETRQIVLDSIVINKTTFNIFKTELLYDTDIKIRNKTLSLIEKKIPNKFIDSKFKKQIIDCLWRNKNNSLMEKFIIKWTSDTNKSANLIQSLDLSQLWYDCLEHNEIYYNDEKLLTIMNMFYKQEESLLVKVTELNQIIAEESLFDNLNAAFYFRSLVHHLSQLNKNDFILKHLIIDMEDLEVDLLNKLKEAKTSTQIINLYNLLDAFLCLNATSLDFSNVNLVFKYLNAIKYDTASECLFDLVIQRLKKKDLSKIIMFLCSQMDHSLELLSCLSLALAKYDQNDFDSLEAVNEDELNVIEYLITGIISKSITNIDPAVRALSVKCLGLAASTSKTIFESYADFLLKIFILDHSIVIHEALKALFNITMNFFSNENESCLVILTTLEKQLDCLNDHQVEFIAYEGFAKLFLLNYSKLPNNKRLLLKLLNGYFNETIETDSDDLEIQKHKRKLKSCLCSFFEEFTKKIDNRNELANLALPCFEIVFNRSDLNVSFVKNMAAMFYYFTYKTFDLRQLIISAILDRVNLKIKNQLLIEKWIEVMLVFDVNQCDVSLDNKEKSVEILKMLSIKMEKTMETIKAKKWKIAKEKELKHLSTQIKSLTSRNDRKRALKRSDSVELVDDIDATVILNQTPVKKTKLNDLTNSFSRK